MKYSTITNLLFTCLLVLCSASCYWGGDVFHRYDENNPASKPIPGELKVLKFNCVYSYLSNDPGYGEYYTDGGCLDGTVSMEFTDHKGTIFDAERNCKKRGLRLPTLHEMSAAGNYASDLNLSRGNYWVNSVMEPSYEHNCYMPTGNCGRHDPEAIQYYRCVENR